MKRTAVMIVGWLVPGGGYLLLRRRTQFATFAVLVTATFAAGLWLGGSPSWPQAAELAGLDGFTAFGFRAVAAAKALAGLPYLASTIFDAGTFLEGRLHEYGSALLLIAGLTNLLAISTALDLRKEANR